MLSACSCRAYCAIHSHFVYLGQSSSWEPHPRVNRVTSRIKINGWRYITLHGNCNFPLRCESERQSQGLQYEWGWKGAGHKAGRMPKTLFLEKFLMQTTSGVPGLCQPKGMSGVGAGIETKRRAAFRAVERRCQPCCLTLGLVKVTWMEG